MTVGSLLTDPKGIAALRLALVIAGDEMPAGARRAAHELVESLSALAQHRVVRWLNPRHGEHWIDGTRIDSKLHGLRAAWLAISRHEVDAVRTADCVGPNVRFADVTVRAALRRAARFMQALRPELASALFAMEVAGGFIRYRPQRHVTVVTA